MGHSSYSTCIVARKHYVGQQRRWASLGDPKMLGSSRSNGTRQRIEKTLN